MITQLFLDMDGVLINWDKAVCDWFGVPPWNPSKWEIPYTEIFGFDSKEFWKQLDYKDFWANLPWYDDGRQILALCEPFKPVILSHGRVPQAYAGKVEWLHRELPNVVHEGRYLLSGIRKDYVSHPGAVLIDDADHNCKAWEKKKNPGKAICYPRPWNSNRGVRDPLGFLMNMLWLYHRDLTPIQQVAIC